MSDARLQVPTFTDAQRARLAQIVTDLKTCLPMPRHRLEEFVGLVTKEAARYGVTYEEVMSLSRVRGGMNVSTKPIAQARQACMAAVRLTMTEQGRPISYPRLGRLFRRDHTTCLAGVKRHQASVAVD